MPSDHVNELLQFASDKNANVEGQNAYAALSWLKTGFKSGRVSSAIMNKILRQGTTASAMLGAFIVEQLAEDVVDNGDLDTLLDQFIRALEKYCASLAAGADMDVNGTKLIDWLNSLVKKVDLASADGAAMVGYGKATVEDSLDTLISNANTRHSYHKKIKAILKIEFDGYDEVVEKENADWFYPQGIALSPDEKSLYIQYTGSAGSTSNGYIVEYDWVTFEQKRYFQCGYSWNEGFFVFNNNGRTFITLISNDNGNRYAADFDITDVSNGGIASRTSIHYGINGGQMGKCGDTIYAIQSTPEINTIAAERTISILDEKYNYKGIISLDPSIVAPFGGYAPKFQGFSVGGGVFAIAMGALLHESEDSGVSNYIGTAIFSPSGKLVRHCLCEPVSFREKMTSITGQKSDRTECEGVMVDSSGKVFSLIITYTGSDANMHIIEDFAPVSSDSFDFTECATGIGTIPQDIFFPYRLGNNESDVSVMKNPLTGESIKTLNDIVNVMINARLRKFYFYTNTFEITRTNGNSLPPNTWVEITNWSNSTMLVELTNQYSTPNFLLKIDLDTKKIKEETYFYQTGVASDCHALEIRVGQHQCNTSTSNMPDGCTYGILERKVYDANNVQNWFFPNGNTAKAGHVYFSSYNSGSSIWSDWAELLTTINPSS